MKKIIIFGGSFNPPHIGHALMIENVIRLFDCDEVWVMPSADRRDKKIEVNATDRIQMARIMIKENFQKSKIPIKISDLEIKRSGFTTTYDTILELEKKYPKNKFYFLIGSDSLLDIKTKWVKGKILWDKLNFVVVSRINFEMPKNLPSHCEILADKINGLDVSSTFLRELINNGYSGMPYMSKGIAEYIKIHKLYKKSRS